MEWAILARVPEAERQRVLQVARRRTFERHEVVFHRGDPADTLHLVVKGRFAARITTPYGDTAVLSVIGPGDVFGELALIDDVPRSATVVALEPGETRSLHKVDFEVLRERHADVAQVLIDVLATRLRRVTELLVEALYVPADTRVLRRVCDLAESFGQGAAGEIPLTQEELAGVAGTSRATVNRVLRESERLGDVALKRGRVVVLDPVAIRRRAR